MGCSPRQYSRGQNSVSAADWEGEPAERMAPTSSRLIYAVGLRFQNPALVIQAAACCNIFSTFLSRSRATSSAAAFAYGAKKLAILS